MENLSIPMLGGSESKASHAPSSHSPSLCRESRLCPGPDPIGVSSVQSRDSVGLLRGIALQSPAFFVTILTTSIYSVTYGSLCFRSGAFDGTTAPDGVAIWLLGGAAAQVAVLAFSNVPFGVGLPTIEMLPIFHAVFANVATDLGAVGAGADEVLATCIATTFLSTFALGIILNVGAYFGCSRWLRAVPVVVLKGALFGVSIFLLQSAVQIASGDGGGGGGQGSGEDFLADWPRWGAAAGLGTLVFAVDLGTRSPVLIALLLLAIAAGPQLADLTGLVQTADLRSAGWLLPLPTEGSGLPWYEQLASVYAAALPRVSWAVALARVPAMFGLFLTHLLCTLMDLKAIELLTQTEVNLDSELRAIGIGNIISACVGCGWPVYLLCSSNVTAYKLGGRSKAVGVANLVGIIPMLFVARGLVPNLPRALPGGVAWWLGLVFMKETLLDIILQHSSRVDVGIVLVMAVIMTTAGLMEGLLVGFLLAVWSFAFQYASMSTVVRASDNASFFNSNAMRPVAQRAVLEKFGHRIAVLHVDGYLMFGSSPQLVDAVMPFFLSEYGPSWIVLNFRGVQGLDYSAVCDLLHLGRKAAARKCSIILTELRGTVPMSLKRAGVSLPELPLADPTDSRFGLCRVADYSSALKCCEDALILSVSPLPLDSTPEDLSAACLSVLEDAFGDFLDDPHDAARDLLDYFDQVEYAPGSTLWEAGDHATFCVGVVKGQLHGWQPRSSRCEQPKLMEVVCVGNFVGFASLLSHMPYGHSVVVPKDGPPCRALALQLGSFAALSDKRPTLANAVLRAWLRRLGHEWQTLSRLSAQV